MPLDRRDVEQALETKLQFRCGQGDHREFTLHIAGKMVTKTKTSRGTKHKTIGDELLGQMARQLFVPRKFFEDLVKCLKTKTDYLRSLADRGIVPADAITE